MGHFTLDTVVVEVVLLVEEVLLVGVVLVPAELPEESTQTV